jgi:hypothetical protein
MLNMLEKTAHFALVCLIFVTERSLFICKTISNANWTNYHNCVAHVDRIVMNVLVVEIEKRLSILDSEISDQQIKWVNVIDVCLNG